VSSKILQEKISAAVVSTEVRTAKAAPIASTVKQIPSTTCPLRGHQLPNQYTSGCSHVPRKIKAVITRFATALAMATESEARRPIHPPASAMNVAAMSGIATGNGMSVVIIA
jgi:hypothetical protein